MKPFKSFLAPKLNEFLIYRQSLGYSVDTIRYHLLLFDRYVMEKNAGWRSFQPGFFLEMRSNLPKTTTRSSCRTRKLMRTACKNPNGWSWSAFARIWAAFRSATKVVKPKVNSAVGSVRATVRTTTHRDAFAKVRRQRICRSPSTHSSATHASRSGKGPENEFATFKTI